MTLDMWDIDISHMTYDTDFWNISEGIFGFRYKSLYSSTFPFQKKNKSQNFRIRIVLEDHIIKKSPFIDEKIEIKLDKVTRPINL